MQILHIGLVYFKVTLHVGIVFKAKFSFKGIQTIYMGYFETIIHVGITFRVNFSLKFVIPTFILTFTNWNFGALLNTCPHTYLYQLEFWGLIAILALVLTSTN
jgi:hypothetical protein